MNPFEMPSPNPFGKTWLTSSFEAPAQSTHDYSLYREDFGSIYSLLNTINNRENNSFMRNEDSSQEHGNEEWSGTSFKLLDWLEAKNIVDTGYSFHLHSMNPVGVQNMRAIIKKNGWKEI